MEKQDLENIDLIIGDKLLKLEDIVEEKIIYLENQLKQMKEHLDKIKNKKVINYNDY